MRLYCNDLFSTQKEDFWRQKKTKIILFFGKKSSIRPRSYKEDLFGNTALTTGTGERFNLKWGKIQFKLKFNMM